ncbi:endonuclease domain-containing protein [Saccharopolyspora sp. 5N708]|uniref:endonuclease domain-containing protein n=1 Tax=Saccharopolyspora sp. 5N708 TaxID=3457424 RepID=UPI003FD1171C
MEIHDDRGFVARVDLALEEAKIAVEYDGAWHADPVQHALDQERLRRIRRSGWHVVVVTAERLYQRLPELLAEIRAAVAARR